jgi:hypothetical protein
LNLHDIVTGKIVKGGVMPRRVESHMWDRRRPDTIGQLRGVLLNVE